jgi:hypothetical protein
MVIVASNYIPESVQSAYGDLDARVILETFGVDVFSLPPAPAVCDAIHLYCLDSQICPRLLLCTYWGIPQFYVVIYYFLSPNRLRIYESLRTAR